MQTGILLILLGKIVLFEDKTHVAGYGPENSLPDDDLVSTQSQDYSNDTGLYPNEDRLRQIIRDELSAQLDGIFATDKQSDAVIAAELPDSAENQYQRDLVVEQLQYHTSVGSISEADMSRLQMEIAKLDDSGRKEMLQMLTQALNSGDLEGRL